MGLWSPITLRDDNPFEDEDEDNMVLNFSHEIHQPTSKLEVSTNSSEQATPTLSPLTTQSHTTAAAESAVDASAQPDKLKYPPGTDLESLPSYTQVENIDSRPQLGLGIGGLWGGDGRSTTEPDLFPTKRRWTVNERVS